MDLHYKQEITVGGLVIVALAVLFGGLAWLSGRSAIGGGVVRFGVRYDNVSGLASGDPVLVSGVRVGRVADFDLQGVDNVIIYLEVGRGVAPRVDAEARVRSIDPLSGLYVDYRPGVAESPLREGTILDGTREQDALSAVNVLADRAGGVLTSAGELLSAETATEVRATLAATRQAMEVVAAVGTGPTIQSLNRTLDALASAATRLDSTLGSPDLARSVAQLDEITEGLNEMVEGLGNATTALGEIMRKVDSDSGTFGRLVNDTTLYNEMVRLSVSMRMLLDDVRERPGRYFNLRVF